MARRYVVHAQSTEVRAWWLELLELVADGLEVRVADVGTFRRATRHARVVRHPKSRELMRLDGTTTVQFRAAKAARERVR